MPNGVYREIYKIYFDDRDAERVTFKMQTSAYEVDNAENILK